MKGKVLSVNISDKKGEKKHNVDRCLLVAQLGLQGDAHAGFQHRQVSLLAKSSVDKMKALGADVEFGDFAENITLEGIEVSTLPIGTRLRAGEAVLEVTQIGKECHAHCAIYQQVGTCVMPTEGIFTRVLAGGKVAPGDTITIIAKS